MTDMRNREDPAEMTVQAAPRRVGFHLAQVIAVVSLATVLGAAAFLIQLILGR
jgi:hypothetical protein